MYSRVNKNPSLISDFRRDLNIVYFLLGIWRRGNTQKKIYKNPSAWNFLSPKPEATCGTVAI